jgi:hypothetical protein
MDREPLHPAFSTASDQEALKRAQREAALTETQRAQYQALRREQQQKRAAMAADFEAHKAVLIAREKEKLLSEKPTIEHRKHLTPTGQQERPHALEGLRQLVTKQFITPWEQRARERHAEAKAREIVQDQHGRAMEQQTHDHNRERDDFLHAAEQERQRQHQAEHVRTAFNREAREPLTHTFNREGRGR